MSEYKSFGCVFNLDMSHEIYELTAHLFYEQSSHDHDYSEKTIVNFPSNKKAPKLNLITFENEAKISAVIDFASHSALHRMTVMQNPAVLINICYMVNNVPE